MPESPSTLVPLTIAAMRRRESRERTLRRVQTGEIAGENVNGRWYVHAADAAPREQAGSPAPVAA